MIKATTTEYFELAINRKMYSNTSNLKFHLNYIFDNVELTHKKVLDIGGGSGLLTFFAAAQGAEKVVCLEPECSGSSSGMIDKFNEFRSALSDSLHIEQLPMTLQKYLEQSSEEEFDVVILHASINHLDEEACINLLKNKTSYRIYKDLLTGVFNKMKKGGVLIASDCSCNNFFNSIGAKNILVPTIEWHKHQKPSTWIALLEEIGFVNPKLKWGSPNTFGKIGKLLMGNSFVSYLTTSHFTIAIEKPN